MFYNQETETPDQDEVGVPSEVPEEEEKEEEEKEEDEE
jgi:hypothetical protein